MEIIKKYFTNLTKQQLEQFEMLGALYAEWNARVNIVSRKDIENLYERHILNSLAIAKVIKFKKNTGILDVGTGGGFPGIPLAIMFPEANFYLVDSVGKKIKVVKAVVESLGLTNVEAEQIRAESLKIEFDFVVSRAVAPIPTFVNWVQRRIYPKGFNDLPNGILYLKGGDFRDEINSLKIHSRIYNISDYFDEEYYETKKLVHLWLPNYPTKKKK